MTNTWTTYLNGTAIATHHSEMKAKVFQENKAFELACQKKWSKSNLETLCSGEVERFAIEENPNQEGGSFSIVIKARPHLCVGICQTRQEAEQHKAWCERHHWTI